MRRSIVLTAVIVIVAATAVGVYFLTSQGEVDNPEELISDVELRFTLESPSFVDGAPIPSMYSHEAGDLSPPLSWSGAPEDAACFVLIVYDPDVPSGIFYHWLLYDIPADLDGLPSGVPHEETTAYGVQGRNDYGTIGYGGPYPPTGEEHRYVFLLLALDRELGLSPGSTAKQVLNACVGHVIAYAKLVGTYSR